MTTVKASNKSQEKKISDGKAVVKEYFRVPRTPFHSRNVAGYNNLPGIGEYITLFTVCSQLIRLRNVL